MKIFDFLDSPDIAAHCESIGHTFNPLEMAVIITMSDKPLREKIGAWQEIIDTCPDMPIIGFDGVEDRESLHAYLREVIAGEEKNMQDFYTPKDGCVYDICAWKRSNQGYDGSYLSSTAEKAWAAFNKYAEYHSDCTSIHISKQHIDEGFHDTAFLTRDGEPRAFYIFEGFRNELAEIFIHLPMPFVRGDLVEVDGEPSVLESLMHWDADSRFKYEDFVSGKIGDSSDMQAGFYYIDPSGFITWEHGHYFGLRYYKGELKGRERFLAYLSKYLKYSDSPIALPWLLNAYAMMKTDEDFEELDKRFICYSTDSRGE